MPVKSTIEINVKAAGFKDFAEAFEKYRASLTSSAGDWAKTVTASRKAAKGILNVSSVLDFQTRMAKQKAAAEREAAKAAVLVAKEEAKAAKARKEADKAAAEAAKARLKIMKDMLKVAEETAAVIMVSTGNLLKWVGIGSIFSSMTSVAGGLGALTNLAQGASTTRREAMGLGVSPGQLRAVRAVYGQILDPQSFLASIAQAQADPSQWGKFAAIGVNPQGKSAADLVPEIIDKAAEASRQSQQPGGIPLETRRQMGYGQFMSLEDLRELGTLKQDELNRSRQLYNDSKKDLNQNDRLLEANQKFMVALALAEQHIKKTFVDKLTQLEPALGHLIDAFVKTFDKLAASQGLNNFIENFATAIGKFGEYLASDKFQEDVKSFVNNFDLVCQKLVAGLVWLNVIPDPKTPHADVPGHWERTPSRGPPASPFPWDRRNISRWNAQPFTWVPDAGSGGSAKPYKGFVPTPEALRGFPLGVQAGLFAESGFNTSAYNRDLTGRTRGARGLAQLRGDRIDKFRQTEGMDPLGAPLDKSADFIIKEMNKQTYDAIMSAKTVGEQLDAFLVGYEGLKRGSKDYMTDWKNAMPWIKVMVSNTSGANVNATAASLGAQSQ
jgi:hypothetical protein